MLPNNTFSYTVHSFQTNRILHPAEASSQLTPSYTYQLLFLGLRLVRLSSHHWEFFLVQSARLPIFKRYNYVCNYRKLCITCKRMPKCEIYVHLRLCMFARCWWICNAGRAKRLVINANGLIFQMDFYFHFIYLPCRLILKVNKVCELANLNFLSHITTPLPGRHHPSALHLLDWQIFTCTTNTSDCTAVTLYQLLHAYASQPSKRLFEILCRCFHLFSHAQHILSLWLGARAPKDYAVNWP